MSASGVWDWSGRSSGIGQVRIPQRLQNLKLEPPRRGGPTKEQRLQPPRTLRGTKESQGLEPQRSTEGHRENQDSKLLERDEPMRAVRSAGAFLIGHRLRVPGRAVLC